MSNNQASIDGLLLVDKSEGLTSHDVVLMVRRAYGERSIGHLGTLDPFATGLLVLLLGRCTRLATFIDNEPKVYEATIRFGAATDTDDCTGQVIRTSDFIPDLDSINAAILTLTGDIMQTPPIYSAKKVDGKRAYDAARSGEEIELKPSPIHVHKWVINSFSHRDLSVTITCGGGTYIRALARDLGEATGSPAHLTTLRRIQSGEFSVNNAVTIHQLKEAVELPPVQPLKVVVG